MGKMYSLEAIYLTFLLTILICVNLSVASQIKPSQHITNEENNDSIVEKRSPEEIYGAPYYTFGESKHTPEDLDLQRIKRGSKDFQNPKEEKNSKFRKIADQKQNTASENPIPSSSPKNLSSLKTKLENFKAQREAEQKKVLNSKSSSIKAEPKYKHKDTTEKPKSSRLSKPSKQTPSGKVIKKRENQVISTVSSSSFKTSSSNSSSKVVEKKTISKNNEKIAKTKLNAESAHNFESASRVETSGDTADKEENHVSSTPASDDFTVLDYEDETVKPNKTTEIIPTEVGSTTTKPSDQSSNHSMDSNTGRELDSESAENSIEMVNIPIIRNSTEKPNCADVIDHMTGKFNKLRKQFRYFSKDFKKLYNSTCVGKQNCTQCVDTSALAQLKTLNTTSVNTTETTNSNTELDAKINVVSYEKTKFKKKKKLQKSIPLDAVIIEMTTTEAYTETTTMNDDITESTTPYITTESTTLQDQTAESTTPWTTELTTEPILFEDETTTSLPTTTIQSDYNSPDDGINEVHDFYPETYNSVKYPATTVSPFKSSVSYNTENTKKKMKVVCSVEYEQPIQKGCFLSNDNNITPTGPDGVIKNPFINEKATKNPFVQRNQKVCCYIPNNDGSLQPQQYYPQVPYMPYYPPMYTPTGYAGGMYPPWNPYSMIPAPVAIPPQPYMLSAPCDDLSVVEGKQLNQEDDDVKVMAVPTERFGRLLNETSPKVTDNIMCSEDEFTCLNGLECIPQSSFCDNTVHCSDASDEAQCSCRSLIGPAKICDGIFDCPRGEDELSCFDCPANSFSCDNWDRRKSQATCVSYEKRCDFNRDCNNGKDEVDCSALTNSITDLKDEFVSYGEGYLHHNYEGKWFPVCYSKTKKFVNSWALEICQIEIDSEIQSVQVFPKRQDTTYVGLFIQERADGLTLVNTCESFKTVAYVQCPKPSCGSRIETKSELLRSQERMTRALNISRDYNGYFDPLEYRSSLTNEDRILPYDPTMEYFADRKDMLSKYDFLRPNYEPDFNPSQESILYNNPSQGYHSHPAGVDAKDCPLCNPNLGDRIVNPNQFRTYEEISNQYEQIPYHYQVRTNQNQPDPRYLNQYFDMGLDQIGNIEHPDNYLIRNKRDLSQNIDHNQESSDQIPDAIVSQEAIVGSERVVGGKKSELGAWPWLIALYKDGYFHCGGVILDESWVMTAAHCVDGFENHYFEVHAGMLRRFSYAPSEQVRSVSLITMHSMFKRAEMVNDIALLRLNEPLRYNRYVRPICLPEATENPSPYIACTAVGWGAIFEHGPDPDHMREVEVPILPNCKHFEDDTAEVICAGMPQGGRDTCQGDSGGPLLCRIPSDERRWYVAGVVSHGEGCARPNEPGVYTRVSQFVPWLLSHSETGGFQFGSRKPLQECPGFQCSNKCIPLKRKCDTIVDCLNAEDELNCNGQFFREDSILGISNNSTLSNLDLNERISLMSNTNNVETSTTTEIPSTTTIPPVASTTVSTTRENNTEATSIALPERTTIADEIITSTTSLPETTMSSVATTTVSSVQEDDGALLTSNNKLDITQNSRSYNFTYTTRKFFSCEQIPQMIPIKRRCDGIIDCEDGTDEKDCSCKDILLINHQHEKLCDGVVDCSDQADENFCSDCDDDEEFDCSKSHMCIPIEMRCDGVPQCTMGEDETDCAMLSSNSIIEIDNAGRPKLAMEGYISTNQNGVWGIKCIDQHSKIVAREMCSELGFSEYKSFDEVMVKTNNKTCKGLKVECAYLNNVDISKRTPWHVDIYIEGILSCSGILIDLSTVVTSENCLVGVNPSINYITAVVGRNSSLPLVMGPYEQIVRVDSIRGPAMHLSKPIEISYESIPISLPTWAKDAVPSETCMITKYAADYTPINIELEVSTECENKKRCYTIKDRSFCRQLSLELDSAGVVCKSSLMGWYLATLYTKFSVSELESMCNGKVISFNSAHDYLPEIEFPEANPLSDPSCESGLRCGRGQCVGLNQLCDGIRQCPDGLDESDDFCDQKNEISEADDNNKCSVNELQCGNKNCIPKTLYCNKKDDCGDGTDEPKDCETSCVSYLKLAHPNWICDGRRNCLDKSDEMNCPCTETSFRCLRSSKSTSKEQSCISNELICDGKNDCDDGSDEAECMLLDTYDPNTSSMSSGIVLKRSFGMWHTKCFNETTMDPSVMTDTCLDLGFQYAKHGEAFLTDERPVVDVFSMIKLKPKKVKISFRSNRPIIEKIHDSKKPCLGLKLQCV